MLNLGSGALGTRGQSKSGCTSASCLVRKYIGIIKEELLFFFFPCFHRWATSFLNKPTLFANM